MKNNRKPWTKEDEEYLLDSYGILTMKAIVNKLNRTEDAIRLKFLDLTGTKDMLLAGGLLSPPQVAEALGVEHRTVTTWIREYGLKAKQLNKVDRTFRYFIQPSDVWSWLKKNKERVNFARIKRGIILPEPDWLQTEISKAEYVKPPKNWTPEEDHKAYLWWQGGVNYKEIAKRLNRPEKGTQRRLTYLRKTHQDEHKKTKSHIG